MKPIDPISSRFSPMKFVADKPIGTEVWQSVLEAGRWAPSAFNEQPWRFVWASRQQPEQFNRVISLLSEYNQQWACDAQILMVVIASEKLARNGKPNPHAWYDTGMSVSQMVIQALSFGIQAHQMGGFDAEKARALLGIPEGYQPICVVAFGYPDALENVLPQFRERAVTVRSRKPLTEVFFQGNFGQAAD
ncbi:MAG TPA: nitroreductase family protein [Bacteroidales bacterium]|nr:nitroreductase family protein [Bacteroidales bacterium]HRZ48640.1 nitroreductase family protein [Bacteroidales bacterium]